MCVALALNCSTEALIASVNSYIMWARTFERKKTVHVV